MPQHNPSPIPCPHCGGTDRYTKRVNAGENSHLLPIGFLHTGRFNLVVCGKCGLTEWFVSNESLPWVREKFDRFE